MKKKLELPSTAVGRRRLLKLAGLLEADAKNKTGIKFDLAIWGSAEGEGAAVSCNTTACAMGLAVASGAFIRAGLRPMPKSGRLVPRVGRLIGFDAAARLFSITNIESEWLFMDDYYDWSETRGARGERAVAKRIRGFVAGRATPG